MSAQVTILQLPSAGPITGFESVPIVQNGVTVQTTTGAIAGVGGSINPITINSTTITTAINIASGENGFSVGPMTIGSGGSVTVASGQQWVVF